jgi:hypothetical protein
VQIRTKYACSKQSVSSEKKKHLNETRMQSQGLKAARKSGFCPYFRGVFGGSALFASEIVGENIAKISGAFTGRTKIASF